MYIIVELGLPLYVLCTYICTLYEYVVHRTMLQVYQSHSPLSLQSPLSFTGQPYIVRVAYYLHIYKYPVWFFLLAESTQIALPVQVCTNSWYDVVHDVLCCMYAHARTYCDIYVQVCMYTALLQSYKRESYECRVADPQPTMYLVQGTMYIVPCT